MANLKFEKEIFLKGAVLIGGVDEAGRGPLAGPVVAACVACDSSFKINKAMRGVMDSKKINHKKREEIFNIIQNSIPYVGIGICDHEIVDKVNILQATFLAMEKAVKQIEAKIDFLMIDGNFIIPQVKLNQKAYVKGDERVFLIGAASIIAKVTRDRIMEEMHNKYPEYGFDKHKGYGTKLHMDNLEKYGPCEIHRKSFKPVQKVLKK